MSRGELHTRARTHIADDNTCSYFFSFIKKKKTSLKAVLGNHQANTGLVAGCWIWLTLKLSLLWFCYLVICFVFFCLCFKCAALSKRAFQNYFSCSHVLSALQKDCEHAKRHLSLKSEAGARVGIHGPVIENRSSCEWRHEKHFFFFPLQLQCSNSSRCIGTFYFDFLIPFTLERKILCH